MKCNPPDFMKCGSYERYKTELKAWGLITEVDAKKRGIAVAMTLPQGHGHESAIREKVFDEMKLEDLNKDNGLDKLIEFLDEKLGIDDLTNSLEKFENFEDFQREQGQSITEYIAKFDQKYNRMKNLNINLPSEILAFKLLRKANIAKEEKMLVLTGMDYGNKATLYEQAKKSLRKFKGEQAGGGESVSGIGGAAIKLEPAFLAEHEDVLMAAGYMRKSKNSGSSGVGGGRSKNGWRGGGRGGWRGNRSRGGVSENLSGVGGKNAQNGDKRERHMNPTGADGTVLRCLACGSFRHMLAECPDSWENMSQVNIAEAKQNENVVLYTGFNKVNVAELGREAKNCAVLDCACSSTVCGSNWLECYMESLDPKDKAKVTCTRGEKVFKFGGGEILKSEGSYTIPAILAGKEVTKKMSASNKVCVLDIFCSSSVPQYKLPQVVS